MGVNTAYGHGINIWGGIETFPTYKFSQPAGPDDVPQYSSMLTLFESTGKNGGSLNAQRTPLYPLFLGAVYATAGVHPLILRHVQLMILALVGGSLPLLGSLWWEKRGLIAGLIGGPIFMMNNFLFADYILVESFFIGMLCCFCLSIAWYESRNTLGRAILAGCLLGLCLLTKATIMVLPLLVIPLLTFRRKDMAALVFSCALIILPWCVHISRAANTPVILVTQLHGDNSLLLDAHNEYTSADGMWHPEWRNNAESFYNTHQTYTSPMRRVAEFYNAHRHLVFQNALSKLIASFVPISALTLIALLCIVEAVAGVRLQKSTYLRWALLAGGVALWWFVLLGPNARILFLQFLHKHPFVLFSMCLLSLYGVLRHSRKALVRIPPIMSALILNFAVMMMLIMSDDAVYQSRYVKVADFLFILTAVYMCMTWVLPPTLKEKIR